MLNRHLGSVSLLPLLTYMSRGSGAPPAVPGPEPEPEPETPAVPTLSGAWVIYVARDIDLVAGTWTARPVGGAPALVMDAVGTPALVKNMTWAPGIPVLSCASGCFYADRETPFDQTAGFSFAACTNTVSDGANLGTSVLGYNGPVIFSNSSATALQFGAGTSSMFTGIGIGIGIGIGNRTGTGRMRTWGHTAGAGDLFQWDRAQGQSLTLNAAGNFSAYINNTAPTVGVAGSATTRSDGVRFILGGCSGTDGIVSPSPAYRVLMAALKVDGTPGTADDRAALVTFANGLKAGTIL